MGLFEIHCHTSEVSACAKLDAASVVKMHKKAGFEGICITDHYHEMFFQKHENRTSEQIVDIFLSGFKIAEKIGKKIGLKVMLGMEIKFTENQNDYLIYGITEELIYKNPLMFRWSLEKFSLIAHQNNIMLIQAHPFRDDMVRVESELLDGIEAYNGNVRHNSRNDISERYAEQNNLIKIGGSDVHRECDVNLASMNFSSDVNNSSDLVAAIRKNEYAIIKNSLKEVLI